MKRLTLLITAFLLASFTMNAQHVTEEQALQKAHEFLNKKTTGGRRNAPGKVRQLVKAAQNDTFYIFNAEDNGGFVIVSGDERTEEILGYSTEGNIDPDNMPENMKALLKSYEEQIKAIPTNAVSAKTKTISETPIEPLIKSQWGQSYPYYMQTPEIEGEHCVTGCIATSMAQIMNYWQYPSATVAAIPAWQGLDEVPSGTAIDWSNMRNYYDYDWANVDDNLTLGDTFFSEEEHAAVAQLMKLCGMSVKMNYGIEASSAYVTDAIQAFQNYFGYQNEMRYVNFRDYTNENWQRLIYNELSQKRPVIYGGYTDPYGFILVEGGHSFIVDGYSEAGFFHVNWGWGDRSNGYYLLAILDDYTWNMDAVLGIQPEAGGVIADVETIGTYTNDINVLSLTNVEVDGTIWRYDLRPDAYDITLTLTNTSDIMYKGLVYVCFIENETGSRYMRCINVEVPANGSTEFVLPSYFCSFDTGIYTMRIAKWGSADDWENPKYINGEFAINVERNRIPDLIIDYTINGIDEKGVVLHGEPCKVHYKISSLWEGDTELKAKLCFEELDDIAIDLGHISYGTPVEGDVDIPDNNIDLDFNSVLVQPSIRFYTEEEKTLKDFLGDRKCEQEGLASQVVFVGKKPLFAKNPVELNTDEFVFEGAPIEFVLPMGYYVFRHDGFQGFQLMNLKDNSEEWAQKEYMKFYNNAWNDYLSGNYLECPTIACGNNSKKYHSIFDCPSETPYSNYIENIIDGQTVYYPCDMNSAKEALARGLYQNEVGTYHLGGYLSFMATYNMSDYDFFDGKYHLYYYPVISDITDIADLSNNKQYLIHTRDKNRGTLGVTDKHLASNNPTAYGPWVCRPVVLDRDNPLITSAGQLSSPYTEPTEGSLAAMIDGNTESFWHSAWSIGDVENGQHYFQVEIPNQANTDVAFKVTRRGTDNDHITEWGVYGTNNADAAKEECTSLAVINTPYNNWGETRVSDIFNTNGYKYLRFYINNTTTSRGFGHFAEFQLYPATYDEVHGDASPFAIIQKDDGYYLYSVLDKAFVTPVNNGNESAHPLLPNDSKMNIYMRDNHFVFDFVETGHTINVNDEPGIAINDYGTLTDRFDDGNLFTIEEVGNFDPTEALARFETQTFTVTYEVMFDGNVVATATEKVASGSALPPMPASLNNSFVTLTETGSHPTTITEDVTVTYNATWNGPFEFSKILASAKWYNMHIRSGWYVGKQDTEPYYPTQDAGELLRTPEYHWAFGGDPYHVKVYNRSKAYWTLTKDGDNAVMRSGDYAWDVLPNNDGFVLRVPGTENTCINQLGGGGGPLQFWTDNNSPTDDGSTFRVEEAQALDDGITSVLESETVAQEWFDLSGRQIVAPKQKGIYIRNRKKVLVK